MVKYVNAKKFFLNFIFYSIVGWIYEIFLEVVVYRWGYMPREFFRGPICPIYGFGAIVLILFFYKYSKKTNINIVKRLLIVFIGSIILTSLIELIASYVFELKTGTWPWRTGYLKYIVNLNGRIALSTSIRFGLISLLCIFLIHRAYDNFMNMLIKKKLFNLFFYIILVLFLLDFIFAYISPTNVNLDIKRA